MARGRIPRIRLFWGVRIRGASREWAAVNRRPLRSATSRRMKILPDWIKTGYLRLIDPVADWLVRWRVHPNTITVIGTLCTVVGGIIYGTGHIRTAGWFLGLTALFDVLDGTVARRSNRSSTFGAFLDSTLDRLAGGAVMAGAPRSSPPDPAPPRQPLP